MKQMRSKYIIFSFILLTLTGQVFARGAKRPIIKSADPITTEAGQESSTPLPLPIEVSGSYAKSISEMVKSSSCFSYSWKNRGKAPAGYIKGVALSFARSFCRMKSQSPLSFILSSADTNNDAKDVLSHYQSTFKSFALQLNVAGVGPLRALYTIGIGLGMRESSGKYCEGWDRSAGSKRSSSAGEAGIFQTSYDSMSASPELLKLYNEYLAKPERCLLDVFKEGVSCKSLSNLGSGAGAQYQAFNKSCPAFATEYAMTMLRLRRAHYGPINRKEAEIIPACEQLFKNIQDFIDKDPYACEDLD